MTSTSPFLEREGNEESAEIIEPNVRVTSAAKDLLERFLVLRHPPRA